MGAALHLLIRAWLAAILILSGAPAFADAPPPARLDRVMDGARVIDPSSLRQLREMSAGLEQRTGAQLIVMTVPTLGGQDIAGYASALLTRWRLGQPGRNNGIILLLVPLQNQARLEIGSGLAGILRPADNERMIAQTLLPSFAQRRHGEGAVATVRLRIMKIQGGQTVQPAPPPLPQPRPDNAFDKVLPWIALTLVIVFAFVILRALLCSRGRYHDYGYHSYDRHHHHWHEGPRGGGLAGSIVSGLFRAAGGRFDGGGASGSW